MSVALLMKKRLGSQLLSKSAGYSSKALRLSVVTMASMMIAVKAMAVVPVVESRPTTTVVSSLQPSSQSVTTSDFSGVAEQAAGGETAHLLNALDQLRNEVMGLRGQVEEQAYLIKQLQQDNRDRYLDLDERVTQLSGGGASGVASLAPASAVPALTETNIPSAMDVSTEKAAYQQAFTLIQEKRFDDAQQALKKQLTNYPNGKYTANAQYWLGEVQMAQAQYAQAKDAFTAVLKNYPDSQKVPDATYKLGRLSDLLGDKQQAKDYLESVIAKYPDSAASRLSDNYLRRLSES